MSDSEHFMAWVSRARNEFAPEPDVTVSVMGRIRLMQAAPERVPTPFMWAMSAACACAAAALGILGYFAWTEMAAAWDPVIHEWSTWWTL